MSVLIGLGSNLDHPEQRVIGALQALGALPESRLLAHSDLYVTAPVGPADQPDFINAVAELRTTLVPLTLLGALQDLEQAAGRVRRRHWGERTLDLDILLWGERQLDMARLTVPHPQMIHRAFVLGPLLERWPQTRLPDGTPLADHWPDVADQPLRRLHRLEEDQFADRTH